MRRLRGWLLRVGELFRKRGRDQELAAELEGHLRMHFDDNLRAGMTQEEARRNALMKLGGVAQIQQDYRERRGLPLLETLLSDLRFAVRMLRKNPGFAAVAVLTLALGIGANTAIFSVVDGVLLQPLAYHEPQQLYRIREIVPQMAKSYPLLDANVQDFWIWQKECHSFEQIAIAESAQAIYRGTGPAEEIYGVRASANLLDVLGVHPALGRTFDAEEDREGRGKVVLLSDSFWESRFHRDTGIVGRKITLDGEPNTIAGVLPASFHFPKELSGSNRQEDFFKPLGGTRFYEQGLLGEFDFVAIGRLRQGIRPEEALAELNVVQEQIAAQAKEGVDLRGQLFPLAGEVVGPARRGLLLLLAAVGAVLLIVCVNLANLFLSRVPKRMREAAIRTALGASRARLMRQMLVESLLLALLGGLLGIWLANVGVQWLVHAAPVDLPRLDEITMNARIFRFALLLSTFIGLLFGILPALKIARAEPQQVLNSSGTRSTESRRTRRLREALVGLEVGLSALLLIVAGLLTASLFHLTRVSIGFAVNDVLAADVDLPEQNYSTPAARQRFYEQVLARIGALPGVRSAGWVSLLPLEGQGSVADISLVGEQIRSEQQVIANYRAVSSQYFTTMDIPLVSGRIFADSDRGRKLVIVSQSLAKRLWPGQDAVGQECIAGWGQLQRSEVIGVVGDIRTARVDRPPLHMVYVPDSYGATLPGAPSSASIVVRTSTDPRSSLAEVRNAIHAVDSEVPIVALRPLTQLVSRNVQARRFQMLLVCCFAASALLLASLGIFGVVAYSVEQRRQELGVRRALGAQQRDLLQLVFRQGMAPVIVGLLAGIVAALAGGGVVQALLYETKAFDPLTIGAVALVVGLVALLACYVPARRAIRIDPIAALRCD